jgi:hypothetical protein
MTTQTTFREGFIAGWMALCGSAPFPVIPPEPEVLGGKTAYQVGLRAGIACAVENRRG